MRSKEYIKQQTKARYTIIINLCIFSIGLGFGEAITERTLEAKILCYKYFNTTSYRKVSGKIECEVKPNHYQVISQSLINKYRRSN